MEEHGEMYEITIESNLESWTSRIIMQNEEQVSLHQRKKWGMERLQEKVSFWKTSNFQLLAENHWLGLF